MTNDKIQITNYEKLLAAAAYAFFISSLYIILTDNRKSSFLACAAAQSLLLWTVFGAMAVLVRFLVGLIWSLVYLPFLEVLVNVFYLFFIVYALFLASRSIYGENYRIPLISSLADKLC